MSVKLEDTVYLHCGTASPTTGAATNADSLPTATVEEDGVAMGYAPTVANVATGLYRITIACTTANGFESGKRYSVYFVATVGGIAGRDGIGEFAVDSVDLTDLPAATITALWAKVIDTTRTFGQFTKNVMAIMMGNKSETVDAGVTTETFYAEDEVSVQLAGEIDTDKTRTIVSEG